MKTMRWLTAILLSGVILSVASTASAATSLAGAPMLSARIDRTVGLLASALPAATGSSGEGYAHPAFTFITNPQWLSGLWYDPTYTGSGFNILVADAGLLVTYYGWDNGHNRLWLTSEIGPKQIGADNPYTLKMYETAGGVFTTPAPPNTNTQWGTLTITFNSCTTATATLDGNDGTVTSNLTQLAGVTSSTGC